MPVKAIKIETEAEGATWHQIIKTQALAKAENLPIYLKIGGAEAKTDINRALELEIDGVIAPMIESQFALEKYDEATREKGFIWRAITIESKTAFNQLVDISEDAKSRGINGMTLGRGDFSASMGMKGQEDSPEINRFTREFIEIVLETGLIPSIGGNVTLESIHNLHNLGVEAKYLETRRVVFDWDKNKPLQGAVDQFSFAIDWEILSLKKLQSNAEQQVGEIQKRISLLQTRKTSFERSKFE